MILPEPHRYLAMAKGVTCSSANRSTHRNGTAELAYQASLEPRYFRGPSTERPRQRLTRSAVSVTSQAVKAIQKKMTGSP